MSAFIVIYGIPFAISTSSSGSVITNLKRDLQNAISPKLGLSPEDMPVFLPADIDQNNIGTNLVCRVSCPSGPEDLRDSMSRAVRAILTEFAKEYLPSCRNVVIVVSHLNNAVECLVKHMLML